MNKEVYIHQHLGLGDHIICNGLIRILCRNFEKVNLFVKKHNLISVNFMFRDIINLNIIPVIDDYEIYQLNIKSNLIRIGHEFLEKIKLINNCTWDEAFYKQLNIPFEYRWSEFKIVRDLERENELFNKLNPNNEPYVLIHSSGSDDIDRINYSKIDNNLLRINVKKEYSENIFDYIKLINNAIEIHVINSSFSCLCDSVDTNGHLFYHNNFNKRNVDNPNKLNKKWNLV